MTEIVAERACILLVEDEEINRLLVRTILQRAPDATLRDAHLIEAADLAQARESLASTEVDVMLVDLQLPDGSGLALVSEIVATTPADKRPAIIALTGDVLPERRAEALAAGCDGFLDKPYTATALRNMLAKHLGRG